jgi:hypothetical protein
MLDPCSLGVCATKTMRLKGALAGVQDLALQGASATHEDTTPPISRLNLSSYFGIVRRSRDASNTQGGHMHHTPFAPLFGFFVLAVSSALAQTTTPPGTAPGTASTPGAGAGAGAGAGTGGGLADWWWIILVLLVVAAAIWYFMRRRGGRV